MEAVLNENLRPLFFNKFYFNPVTKNLNIEVNTALGNIEIYNSFGQHIADVRINKNENTLVYNAEHLSEGVYHLVLFQEGEIVEVDKILIIR
ncbi:MAG: hypothetical protein ACI8ZN_000295 [Bacteroidia bacterium]|jgi:hypothetical protein